MRVDIRGIDIGGSFTCRALANVGSENCVISLFPVQPAGTTIWLSCQSIALKEVRLVSSLNMP